MKSFPIVYNLLFVFFFYISLFYNYYGLSGLAYRVARWVGIRIKGNISRIGIALGLWPLAATHYLNKAVFNYRLGAAWL